MAIAYVAQIIVVTGTILSALLTVLPPASRIARVLAAVVVDLRALIAALSPPVTPPIPPAPPVANIPPAKPPSIPPVALLMIFLLAGCAGNFETMPAKTAARVEPSPYCQGLASDQILFGGLAKGVGILAGVQGLAEIPVNDSTARIGLAIGTSVAAAAGVALGFISDQKATQWATSCAAAPVNPLEAK